MGVLTNGNADIKRLGIDHYFNFSFSAEELNDSKPSATHFEKAMEFTSEKAASICHIGDHTECDVEGALNAGCKAIWYNELNNEWPDSKGCPVQEIKSWYDMEEAISKC